jgi:hypothetical protein
VQRVWGRREFGVANHEAHATRRAMADDVRDCGVDQTLTCGWEARSLAVRLSLELRLCSPVLQRTDGGTVAAGIRLAAPIGLLEYLTPSSIPSQGDILNIGLGPLPAACSALCHREQAPSSEPVQFDADTLYRLVLSDF